jgi:hypothetical protein
MPGAPCSRRCRDNRPPRAAAPVRTRRRSFRLRRKRRTRRARRERQVISFPDSRGRRRVRGAAPRTEIATDRSPLFEPADIVQFENFSVCVHSESPSLVRSGAHRFILEHFSLRTSGCLARPPQLSNWRTPAAERSCSVDSSERVAARGTVLSLDFGKDVWEYLRVAFGLRAWNKNTDEPSVRPQRARRMRVARGRPFAFPDVSMASPFDRRQSASVCSPRRCRGCPRSPAHAMSARARGFTESPAHRVVLASHRTVDSHGPRFNSSREE